MKGRARWGGLALAGALAGNAHAQELAPPRTTPSEEMSARAPSLRARVATEGGQRLLAAGSFEERLRGIDFLASGGRREGLAAIVDALESGGPVMLDARTRLESVRALSAFALLPEVQRVLVTVVEHAFEEDAIPELGLVARDTAILALARAGGGHAPLPNRLAVPATPMGRSPEERAVTPLIAAIIGARPLSAVAVDALVHHPPVTLAPFVRGVARVTAAEVVLLGQLGDPRAIGILRRAFERGDAAVQNEAARALARLGDHSVIPTLRRWIADPVRTPERRAAAVESLLIIGAPEGRADLLGWMKEPGAALAALDLAERWPSNELGPALESVATKHSEPATRVRALELLARIGGDAVIDRLADFARDPHVGAAAVHALARIDAERAGDALDALVSASTGDARRRAARAALVHGVRTNTCSRGRRAAFEALSRAADPADRFLGVLGATVFGVRSVAIDSRSDDRVIRGASVAAAASVGARAIAELEPLARRALARRPLPPGAEEVQRIDALALALVWLVHPELGSALELAEWAESGGIASLQAAYRLGVRDPASLRARVDALLVGTDPLVRAQVALGLGASPERDATARLDRAYRFEADPFVRFAIVQALVQRGAHLEGGVLDRAARLDPDDRVRGFVLRAREGNPDPVSVRPGPFTSEVTLASASPAGAAEARFRIVVGVDSAGLALPTLSAPDGAALVVGGLAPGGRGRVLPLE